ncbi:hypothetical protein M3M50_10670 [Pseudomonas bijieensis]|uniref:hypothetical protein n=1 Tax=Pseudomonas bijieensis TaxID=2681983 RepID=UPI00200FEF8A|nr:hypothetical protein [Pseudomonas bijieensis]UQI33061.1 hypothetical protein M3M50_10670 [Pseudomonas bijieensis]
MDKKELQKMAPELLVALEGLYKAYEEAMLAEYVTWSPEQSGELAVMEAKRLIDLARQ